MVSNRVDHLLLLGIIFIDSIHILLLMRAGIKVRVYCQVGKADQGKFALDVAVKTLDLYKE